MRSVLEGDFKDYRKDENFGKGGYGVQEIDEDSGEFVDIDESGDDMYGEDDGDFDDSYDDTEE